MKNFTRAILFIFIATPFMVSGQKTDSARTIPQPIHKNVIKWNPTPMMLWSTKNLTFGYERILNKKQSVALTLGFLEFPSLFKDSIGGIVAITSREKYGINVALEYRFYLMQRNVRPIPDGLYIGPYMSYYGYHFKNGIDIVPMKIDSGGMIRGNFYIFNVGIELGYQFVFWKRFTLDLVLVGPAISYYGGSVDIGGSLNLEELKTLHEDLYNRLIEKYPMIGDFVINKSFKKNGKLELFSLGFRYCVQLGFHF